MTLIRGDVGRAERATVFVLLALLPPLLWWSRVPGLPSASDVVSRVALSLAGTTALTGVATIVVGRKDAGQILAATVVLIAACYYVLYDIGPRLQSPLIRHRMMAPLALCIVLAVATRLRTAADGFVGGLHRAATLGLACGVIVLTATLSTRPTLLVQGARLSPVGGSSGMLSFAGPHAGGRRANVRDYGAKADGLTDDAAAFEAALRDVGRGGTVYAPMGVYGLSRGVVLDSGVELRGEARERTTLLRLASTGADGAIISNRPGASDVHLVGFTLDAQRQRRAAQSEIGVWIRGGQRAVVESIGVRHTFADGIRFDDGATDGLVQFTLVDDAGADGTSAHGIMLASPATALTAANTLPATTVRHRVTKNVVRFARNTGILMLNAADILVDRNVIEDARLARGINMGANSRNITVLDNVIDRAHSTGIQIAYASDVLIENNVVRGTIADGSGIGNEGQGIKAYVSVRNVRILGNTTLRNATDGVALLPGVTGAVISGNMIGENGRDGIRLHAGIARVLPLAGVADVVIEGNSISANKGDGLSVFSDDIRVAVTNWTAAGNSLSGNGGCSLRVPAGELVATASHNRMVGPVARRACLAQRQ